MSEGQQEFVFWGGYIIGALSWAFPFLLAGIFIGEWKVQLAKRITGWFDRRRV